MDFIIHNKQAVKITIYVISYKMTVKYYSHNICTDVHAIRIVIINEIMCTY